MSQTRIIIRHFSKRYLTITMPGNEQHSSPLKRYSFTLPPNIVDAVDSASDLLGMNRSMIVREALTSWLSAQIGSKDLRGTGVGIISYIYDHHDASVVTELMHVQHDHEEVITSTTHIHLSHSSCFEIVICKGELRAIKSLGDLIRSIKGVKYFSSNFAVE